MCGKSQMRERLLEYTHVEQRDQVHRTQNRDVASISSLYNIIPSNPVLLSFCVKWYPNRVCLRSIERFPRY